MIIDNLRQYYGVLTPALQMRLRGVEEGLFSDNFYF